MIEDKTNSFIDGFYKMKKRSLSPLKKLPQIIGHRGARGRLPENTHASFKYAIEKKVDAIEFDVVLSRDNQLMVFHDLYLNPTLLLKNNGKRIYRKKYLRQLSAQELKSYQLGKLCKKRFPKQKSIAKTSIPTLRESLNFIKAHKPERLFKLNIEFKVIEKNRKASPSPKHLAKVLSEENFRMPLFRKALIQSSNVQFLKEIKKRQPLLDTGYITETRDEDHLKICQKLRCKYLIIHYSLASRKLINSAHALGIKVHVYTANNQAIWLKLSRRGADGIITDYPKELRQFFKQKRVKQQLEQVA